MRMQPTRVARPRPRPRICQAPIQPPTSEGGRAKARRRNAAGVRRVWPSVCGYVRAGSAPRLGAWPCRRVSLAVWLDRRLPSSPRGRPCVCRVSSVHARRGGRHKRISRELEEASRAGKNGGHHHGISRPQLSYGCPHRGLLYVVAISRGCEGQSRDRDESQQGGRPEVPYMQ